MSGDPAFAETLIKLVPAFAKAWADEARMSESNKRAQMFARLALMEIDRIRCFGQLRRYRAGDALFVTGDVAPEEAAEQQDDRDHQHNVRLLESRPQQGRLRRRQLLLRARGFGPALWFDMLQIVRLANHLARCGRAVEDAPNNLAGPVVQAGHANASRQRNYAPSRRKDDGRRDQNEPHHDRDWDLQAAQYFGVRVP